MGKCFWWNQHYVINGVKYTIYFSDSFRYGDYNTIKLKIDTFEQLYKLALNKDLPRCSCGITKFKHKKYVNLGYSWPYTMGENIRITSKNFSQIVFIDGYIEFEPTVKQAMEYLTVEQFKEYAGFDKINIGDN